jgi:hypothetical protein
VTLENVVDGRGPDEPALVACVRRFVCVLSAPLTLPTVPPYVRRYVVVCVVYIVWSR